MWGTHRETKGQCWQRLFMLATTVYESETCCASTSEIRQIHISRTVLPIYASLLRNFCGLSHTVAYEYFPRLAWLAYPVQSHHTVHPYGNWCNGELLWGWQKILYHIRGHMSTYQLWSGYGHFEIRLFDVSSALITLLGLSITATVTAKNAMSLASANTCRWRLSNLFMPLATLLGTLTFLSWLLQSLFAASLTSVFQPVFSSSKFNWN